MKIMICGLGRAGKDQFAKYLGLPFQSSSRVVLNKVLWNEWGRHNYACKEDCFDDRANRRMIWSGFVDDYNQHDPARLGNIILRDNDIYVGCRDIESLNALMAQYDNIRSIWVERPGLTDKSCDITKQDCHTVIYNTRTKSELKASAIELRRKIFRTKGCGYNEG